MSMLLEPIQVRAHRGAGPIVVVLHGGPGAPGSAAGLARALAGEFHVLEPLQRRSGTVPVTVGQHVADLAAVAPDVATLVGWSWGAMLALSFAARRPERVRAIALVGCGTYDETSRALYRRVMDARLGRDGRLRMRQFEDALDRERDAAARDRLLIAVGELAAEAQAWDRVAGDEDDAHDVDAPLADARGQTETWQDALRLQREGVEPAAFERIRVPVLMLHGNHDPHPGQMTRDVLRRFMPQLEYVGFEACGHEPWRERDARGPFLVALRAWLRSAG